MPSRVVKGCSPVASTKVVMASENMSVDWVSGSYVVVGFSADLLGRHVAVRAALHAGFEVEVGVEHHAEAEVCEANVLFDQRPGAVVADQDVRW